MTLLNTSLPDLLTLCGAALVAMVIGAVLWQRRVVSPNAFDGGKSRAKELEPVIPPIWFVCAAMTYIAGAVAAQFAFALPSDLLGPDKSLQRTVVIGSAASGAQIGIGILLIMLIREKLSARSGLSMTRRDIPIGVIALLMTIPAYLAVALASQWLHRLVTGVAPPDIAHETLEQIIANRSNAWAWGSIAIAVIGAPIAEEIVFRVFVQSCFVALFGRVWPAIFVTASIFALVHVGIGQSGPVPWVAIPGLLILGIALGIAYERTRSPLVPIVMHMLFNAANIALALMR